MITVAPPPRALSRSRHKRHATARQRLMLAAARDARAMRQTAARSTSALGWLASWDSLTYFTLPVIAGGLLAPLAIWNLPRHVGLPLALALSLWPLAALAIGSLAALIGLRREHTWQKALPFSLRDHRAALAGKVEPSVVILTFAVAAPSAHTLRRLLERAGLGDARVLLAGVRLQIELCQAHNSSHDQRAYQRAIHRMVDDVALPLHQAHAIVSLSLL